MKISAEILDRILGMRGSGITQCEMVATIKAETGTTITQAAISKILSKHRSERAEISKAVFQNYAEKSIPKDLAAIDRISLANIELLEAAQAACKVEPSLANYEKVTKLTSVVQRSHEQKSKALGLNENEPIIDGLADLLSRAFEE